MSRITAAGGYVPRLRLHREAIEEAWGQFRGGGIERTAVPDGDEDALTMAHAAAARALRAADRDAGSVARLHLGTTTPPLAEGELTARLRSTLGLPDGLATATYSGSTRAGVAALAGALDADETSLVVASDCPRGEPGSDLAHRAGAGAAAILLAPEGGASVTEVAAHTEAFPGTRTRPTGSQTTRGSGVTGYERRAYTETLAGAIDRLDGDPTSVDAAALQAPDRDRPGRLASNLGIPTAALEKATVVGDTGDLGAASAPLGLVGALAEGVERVLVAGYGDGAGATAMLVERTESVPVEQAIEGDVTLTYTAAQRRRGELDAASPAGGGAHVSHPRWRESLPQRHRLEAGACRDCGHAAFPPAGACRACGSRTGYDPVAVGRTGTVEATTTIHQGGAPPEFREQQRRSGSYDSAIVAMETPSSGSVRVPLQVVTTGDRSITIGEEVHTTIRRLYTEEGVPRYARKAVPAATNR